ncbi:hypothetical protein [Bradyrhizobium elkanii]|uniref:hypothetical protein n=1 Tax=Bradyrhizobium elkanii TaxID=29448 RepID=UPI0027155598|nr:hypothetical protein [Bradyrhizobium elkanii]WLA49774.1 hypothetical protein QIH80_06165 [Bradyrhizobium elkanii]WLB79997.1 hypothetical protein QIH83_37840 [Bradyrhizobium elkanii]
MPWNYSVTLNDPSNVGGSADASLVYDLEQALNIWQQYILGIGTLVVSLNILPTAVGRADGGPTSSYYIGTSSGLAVYEPSSQYELTTGQHVPGTTSDITINIDPGYFQYIDLDYGLTYSSQVPGNVINPIDVFLHELMHGFGMVGWYNQSGQLAGAYESTFDTLIQKTAYGAYFVGANAEAAYGGPVPLTTNSTTQNYYHFGNQQSDLYASPSTVQDPLTLDLMNGIVFYGNYQYAISNLDIGVLKDLGYSIRTTPIVTAADQTAARDQVFTASSLFSVNMAAGDSITQYALWDSNGYGHWTVNGTVQGTNTEIDISASQLAQTNYQAGPGSDTLWIRAFDGYLWSDWKSFVISPADRAPTVTATNVTGTHGQLSVAGSGLFSASDADGDGITQYALWDTEGHGHWAINGVAQATNAEIDVSAASISQVSYMFGTASDTLWVRAYDGYLWGAWVRFNATPGPDLAPVVHALNVAAVHGQTSVAASSLITATDPDLDTITRYALWDSNGNGAWVVNGVVQATNTEIDLTPAQFAQTSYQFGSASDQLWVRAYDGIQWGAWVPFMAVPYPNHPPVVIATDVSATHNQNIAASNLFSVTDADSDAIVGYQVWDSTTDPASGHWVIGGVAQASNIAINVTPAQFTNTSFQTGSGSDDLWVRANDGTTWGAWKEFHVNAPIDHAPVASASDVTATHGQTIAATSLFTVSDADSDTITNYQFWDSTADPASGHFVVGGVIQPTGQNIDVSAAQLASTSFQSGSGSDDLWVRAFDGITWSNWKEFHVNAPIDHAPVASASDMTATHGRDIAAASLFTVSDGDSDAMTNYQFWDSTADPASGHFVVGGVIQPTGQNIDVSAAQLASTSFQSGSGSDDLWVRAFDGMTWSNWKEFHVNAPADNLPIVSAADYSASHGQDIAASTLFSVSDADADTITNYQVWDSTVDASSGHWVVGGVAQGTNAAINVTAAQLSSTSFQSGSGSDDLWVRAYDGFAWGAWKEFHVTAPVDSAPVVTASDFHATANQSVAALSLFSVTDADGDSMAQYQFWDSTPSASSGHWSIGGTAQPTGTAINVSAAQIASTTFQGGTVPDDLWVRASDGISWSAWHEFHFIV